MANNTLAIKVDRLLLIKSIEDRIAVATKANKEKEVAEKKYDSEIKEWQLKVLSNPSNFKEVSNGYRHDLEIALTEKAIKSKPTRGSTPEGWLHQNNIDVLEATVRKLKMSTDTTIALRSVSDIEHLL